MRHVMLLLFVFVDSMAIAAMASLRALRLSP